VSAKLKKQILKYLEERPLTLKEISDKMELKEKRTFKLLRSLFQNGEITSFKDEDNQRCYKPAEKF
jgi:predicted transcriptional regulator